LTRQEGLLFRLCQPPRVLRVLIKIDARYQPPTRIENRAYHSRRTADGWNDFLEAFVDDQELIARINAKSPQ
jgi:hypothetical protein